jgi:Mg2+ and Co2+ transporter CorA
MFSDRMVVALDQLSIDDAGSVKRFKRAVRGNFENFLRFTHRYWFHEISEQAQTRELFRMCANHLELDTLYAEVRQRVTEMNSYLDTDSLRRQANTVVRLTVVTTFGLIGTVLTGIFGMNVFAFGDIPLPLQALLFVAMGAAVTALTFYTLAKSKPLADFLDAVSDPHLSVRAKVGVFFKVWTARRERRPGPW